MSTDAAESPSAQGQAGSLTVEDPENYNLSRRLRQIHDARERVPDTIREEANRVSSGRRDDGEITHYRYREIVTDALIDYLIELEPLMLNDDIDTETNYWSGYEVATDGEGRQVTLKRIVDHNGEVAGDGEDDRPLSVGEVRAAFRAANRFFADAGLGVSLDEGLATEGGFSSTEGI